MQIDPGLLVKLGADENGFRAFVGISDYKSIVSRDLERLLNSRRGYLDEAFEGHRLAGLSMLNFGVEDFSGKYFGNSHDVQDVCHAIERCIRLHEPRLASVKVEPNRDVKVVGGLTLEITAQLMGNGVSEAVKFNAMFDVAIKKYEVSGR